jgi:murein DD-endopeptidase MepM/ murein hydrolase activator NlpD
MKRNALHRAHRRGMKFLAVLVVVALLSASHARRAAADTITIDFELAATPQAMRPAITTAMSDKPGTLSTGRRFAIVSLQQEGDWALATIAALDGNPEAVAMGDAGALIILRRNPDGAWQAALEGTREFAPFVSLAPDVVLSATARQSILSTGPVLASAQAVTPTLKFPWDRSQKWYFTQGWHYGNYVDFAPAWGEKNKWVLAAHDGTVTRTCLGPLTANLRVQYSRDFWTEYAHLDINSVPASILGKSVTQGRMLGVTYNLPFSSTQDACGYSTGPHLHFGLPSQTITVDGWTAHPDNIWTNGAAIKGLMSLFSSTNVLNTGLTPRVFVPLLRR